MIKNLAIVIALALAAAGCEPLQEHKTLHLAHSLSTAHPVHQAMDYMGERLAEYSGGDLRVEIYPNNQLGAERELLELVQIGSIDITKVSAAVMENFVPAYKAFGMPYLFESKEHQWAVFQGDIGRSILDRGERYFLKGLGFYDAGSRSFYTRGKAVRTPEDLQGMKIRVMKSQSAIDMVKALGGSPTPISFGELYSALQQNIVDGAENNPPSYDSSAHYEVTDYYTLDEHTSIPDVLVIGTHAWNKLSPQEQQWLTRAVDESVEYQKKLWAEREQASLAEVEAAGIEIIRPDKTPFQEAVQPMYKRYETRQPNVFSIVKQIQQKAESMKAP
jgi:tripartite ATP-independent transporter DctP family solute receptor